MDFQKSNSNEPLIMKTIEPKISCNVCLTEVPASGVQSEETADYVAHFCGSDCYDKWREGQSEES